MLEGEGIPLVRRSNKVTQNYSKNGGAPDPTGRWQVKRSGTSLAQGGITWIPHRLSGSFGTAVPEVCAAERWHMLRGLGDLRKWRNRKSLNIKSQDFIFADFRISELSKSTFPKKHNKPFQKWMMTDGVSSPTLGITDNNNRNTERKVYHMSSISNYLKMNSEELEKEISKQNKRIASAKETIALLKKLQIASNVSNASNQKPYQQNADKGIWLWQA